MNDKEKLEFISRTVKDVKTEISKVIIGQKDIINNLLVSLFAKGNVLLVGVPGLAKTLMIKTLSEVLDLDFSRIQFTPDLMPGDITGTEIIEDDISTGKKEFRFVKGPIFSNIILADEINRTPPKTQAALLEAMQEREVTAAGVNYKLSPPFFVLATQNPIEQEGTYPLPEAQLDRFMFNLWLTYPSFQEEIDVVKSTTSEKATAISKVLKKEEIIMAQELVRKIPVADNLYELAVKLVRETRPGETSSNIVKEYINYGAGPRASQYLILGAKSKAALDGRPSPERSDIKAVAKHVLRHRIVANFKAEADGMDTGRIIDELMEEISS